jgi:ribonucleoside-triphosphate reductase
MKNTILVIKKDLSKEIFDYKKIINAVRKSAKRVFVQLSEEDNKKIVDFVLNEIETEIHVAELHKIVEKALSKVNTEVSSSYKEYRNYKMENAELMNKVFGKVEYTLQGTDKENSNSNYALISTQKVGTSLELAKQMFKKYHLSTQQREMIRKGYIYIHDLSDRIFGSINCCLFDLENVLSGGFNMSKTFYTEPKNISTALDQTRAIIMCASAQQYGGFTVPEIDKTLAKYCELTYDSYLERNRQIIKDICLDDSQIDEEKLKAKAEEQTYRDLKQRLQGLEAELNDVVSARGSYPFTTFTLGDGESYWAQKVTQAILEVRKEGHGKKGFKKQQIFPKLVFLYSKEKHSQGKSLSHLMDMAIDCTSKCMYPDYIGANAYKREDAWVSPMGCRAFLSNYEHEGKNTYVGRFNIGAVSLNLPMIYQKSVRDNLDFWEELEFNLETIREIHKYTYDYMGKKKACSNPLGFMEGGFLGGNLNFNDPVAPLLKSSTASFGITALNELSLLANKKSIKEDNGFANEVMDFINAKVEQFKKEDKINYAIYGTPAESLCKTQAVQYFNEFGKGLSQEYFTNSFHCHVSEELNPFEKQDKEQKLFHKHLGGHIQYVRIPNPENKEGVRSVVERGLDMGFYQGVNFNACTCEHCGAQGNDFGEVCPECGSTDITEINRITGYLGYSRINSDRTLNDGMMANLKDRISM